MIGAYGAIVVDAFYLNPQLEVVNRVEAYTEAATTTPVGRVVMIEEVINWTDERIETEIRKTFPETPNTAVAIAKCENDWNKDSGYVIDQQSNNILSYGREESFGIFQIHARDHNETAVRLGLTKYKSEVRDNLAMARYIYVDAKGFTPWTCYKTGKYKRFL